MNKKIIILDFNSAEVHVFDYTNDIRNDLDFKEFLNYLADARGILLRELDCQWMITDNLNIQIH
jgi:endonuclease IV